MKKLIAILCALALCIGCACAETVFAPENPEQGKRQALLLLEECAFRSEYGEMSGGGPMTRWDQDIKIYVGGQPTAEDLAFLKDFIMQLSFRVPLLPPIYMVPSRSEANMTIYYVPLDEMSQHVSDYVEGNWGFVSFFYRDYCNYRAEICVATDVTTQTDRNHIVMEEIVGGLGLGNDHYVYADSIIYQPWTDVQQLSEVDWLMLNMVYSPVTLPGMTFGQVYDAIIGTIY